MPASKLLRRVMHLWRHQWNVNRTIETRGRYVNTVVFIVINGFVKSCKKLDNVCTFMTYCLCAHRSYILFKGLVTVRRELRPSDLLSGAGVSSYQYKKFHCGNKTILRPSYLHNGISYTGKIDIFILNRGPVSQAPLCLVTTNPFKTGLNPINTSSHEGSGCASRRALCGQFMQEEWFIAVKMIY